MINMKINHGVKYTENKSKEDVFGAYLVEDAKYDGYYDIPFMDVPTDIHLPSRLVGYSKLNKLNFEKYTYCHFYQKDYTFDGRFGIWISLIFNHQFKKGFNLGKFKNVYAIICPDYSMYYDMPRILQILSVYKSRATGYFLIKLGYIVIPNVRWTDKKSYEYSFSGLRKYSIVAVSTLGCLKSKSDKSLFLSGLIELMKRVQPSCIIFYGSLNSEVKTILEEYNQEYAFFPSQIAEAMEIKYGNESK